MMGLGRELERHMTAASRAAFLGILISLSLSAPVSAQFWPWSQPTTSAPAAQAEPPQKVPVPTPAPSRKEGGSTPAASRQSPASSGAPTAARTPRPGEILALDENQRALVDRISLYLSTIHTLLGDFVQV